MARPIPQSVPRLLPRQLVSVLLAAMLSLLSFTVIVRTSQHASRIEHAVSATEGDRPAQLRLLQPLSIPPLLAQWMDRDADAVEGGSNARNPTQHRAHEATQSIKQTAAQNTAQSTAPPPAPDLGGSQARDAASPEPALAAAQGLSRDASSASVSLPDADQAESADNSRTPPTTSTIPTTLATHTPELASERTARAAGYLPATDLSERPVLLQDIHDEIDLASITSADDDLFAITEATGILLINEHGSVDRLLFESPGLPQYLESLLAQRFAEARFLPGKVDGRPVRSALRIVLQLQ